VYTNTIFTTGTSGVADQTCFTPCSVANCPVTPPSYNNFVEWDATDADADFSSSDFGVAARNIGIAIGVGLAVGVAVPLTILAANAGVEGLLAMGP
jgi:hypothetical protein